MIKLLGIVCLIMIFATGMVVAENEGRIYGKITTYDGDILEGLIRWDKNEGNWVDILNGTKDLSHKHSRKQSSRDKKNRNKETSIEIFGITIGKSSSSNWNIYSSAQSGIRFGHIKTLEPIDDRALLVLRSGEEVELYDG